MESRRSSASAHSLDSPPSQTRLAYPLVSHSSTMHDPYGGQHAFEYPTQHYEDTFGVSASAASSPPQEYAIHPTLDSSAHTIGAVRPKRKQVKNACSACQRACKRCDVGRPCERCIKYGMQDTCRDSTRKERKKGVKRGPYKKRDAMLNDLQRSNIPAKARVARVSSLSEPPSYVSNSASQIDQSAPSVQLYPQPVPSSRLNEGPFSYSTPAMVPPTQHPSLTSMHSSSHPSSHSRSEDQYYPPRYDHLTDGSTRPGHYRVDSYPQEYQTKPIPHLIDHQPIRALQYPSPEGSPSRERRFSDQMYGDGSHRHGMIQASPTRPDISFESRHDSPRTIDPHYSFASQQHQRSYERTYQERSYAGEMEDVQPSQQYYPYSAYQNQPPSAHVSQASHSYGYSQNHASHPLASTQHVSDQDSGYMSRPAQDQATYGSSIDSYPTPQPYSSQNPLSNGAHYAIRSAGRMVPPHVGNVQIPSN